MSGRNRRMTRHEIATAIRKRNAEAVAECNTLYRHDGFVEITVTIGEDRVEAFYTDGEELASEAYRNGVTAVGNRLDTVPVMMFTQYHPHSDEIAECDCASQPDHRSVWRNDAAEAAMRDEGYLTSV